MFSDQNPIRVLVVGATHVDDIHLKQNEDCKVCERQIYEKTPKNGVRRRRRSSHFASARVARRRPKGIRRKERKER